MITRKDIRSTISAGLFAAAVLAAPLVATPASAEQVGEVGVDWTHRQISELMDAEACMGTAG